MEELLEILRKPAFPSLMTILRRVKGPAPPFICYLLPGSDNFAADGRVYYKINEVRIELYTDYKDIAVEQRLEAVLERHGIFYDKTETWIESERLYEVLFSFEKEA